MNTTEFVDKFLGKGIDFDKSFGNQCVDVYRQYCKDVIGCPHTGTLTDSAAKNIYKEFDKTLEPLYFDKVDYAEGKVPSIGDVIVYDGGKYGHVAIVIWASKKTCIMMEQDGTKPEQPSRVYFRTYDNCLGWLRKKLK